MTKEQFTNEALKEGRTRSAAIPEITGSAGSPFSQRGALIPAHKKHQSVDDALATAVSAEEEEEAARRATARLAAAIDRIARGPWEKHAKSSGQHYDPVREAAQSSGNRGRPAASAAGTAEEEKSLKRGFPPEIQNPNTSGGATAIVSSSAQTDWAHDISVRAPPTEETGEVQARAYSDCTLNHGLYQSYAVPTKLPTKALSSSSNFTAINKMPSPTKAKPASSRWHSSPPFSCVCASIAAC